MKVGDRSILRLLETAMPQAVTGHETQCELARAAQAGDAEAERKLLIGSVGLVVRLVKPHFRNCEALGLDPADFVSVGLYGLPEGRPVCGMKHAIAKFDTERGIRLSTYARYWVLLAIRELVKRVSVIRGIPANELRARLEAVDEATLGETTPDYPAELDTATEVEELAAAKATLSDIERAVVVGYHEREKPLAVIAKELGIPKSQVKTHLGHAMAKLREAML